MRFKTIKHHTKKKWIITLVVVIAIIATISFVGTKANYKVTQSIPLVRGTINYTLGDVNIMAIYLNGDNGYEQADSIPESGYTLNATESYCKIGDTKQDVTINYDFDTKTISITPLTQNKMKCYLYFDVVTTKTVVAGGLTLDVNLDIPHFYYASCNIDSTYCDEATVGIYETEDDDGISYYYRGNVENNYVFFAGYYWRIIRINGNDSIRLIYAGNTAKKNGEALSGVPSASFNSIGTDNAYVGFMYGAIGSSTYEITHTNTNNSTIKETLDNWYTKNLASYANYLDTNAGFCGDRQASSNYLDLDGVGGYGTSETYYGAFIRVYETFQPTLKCPNNDYYTEKSANKGNKALSNPIGLITADEVLFAGIGYVNPYFYLSFNCDYWTMSPALFKNSAKIIMVDVDTPYANPSSGDASVLPVINLKSGTLTKGSGTIINPYTI